MERLGNVSFIQGDGSRAEVLYQALSRSTEAEVSLARHRFHGGAAVSGASACHWLIIHLDQPSRMCCRIGKRRSDHVAVPGSIVFCPADVDISAESDMQVDSLYLALPREPFGLLAVERSRPNAEFAGVLLARDDTLLDITRELADRVRVSSDGPDAAWRDLSAEIFEHVFDRYLLGERADRRGVLTPEMLTRIHQYVDAHLADSIEVDTLADVVQKSRSHFPRLFRRSVGLSPHQYVVRRRLQRAVQLIRDGHLQLAQVAAETGFVDQSHLTHWMQRVYGHSPARAAGPRRTRRNLQDR
jgi:AraC family transcriptional regulator